MQDNYLQPRIIQPQNGLGVEIIPQDNFISVIVYQVKNGIPKAPKEIINCPLSMANKFFIYDSASQIAKLARTHQIGLQP